MDEGREEEYELREEAMEAVVMAGEPEAEQGGGEAEAKTAKRTRARKPSAWSVQRAVRCAL